MKPFRIRIEVDIMARDREQAERRAGLLYSDLELGAAGHGYVPYCPTALRSAERSNFDKPI